MKKNVYSITLLEDVVRAVDRAAFDCGLTRSALINKILAENLGLSTPETRQRDIFTEMARLMSGDDNFLIHREDRNSLFAVKSSLRFKYNPTIRYSVVIYPDAGDFFGEVRAVLRTQNPGLISELDSFFSMWQKLEDAYFGLRLSDFGSGRFVRRLQTPPNASPDTLGRVTARYIRTLNDGITAHFRLSPDISSSAAMLSELYGDYIRRSNETV
ncbi:MAG: hypothetical protein II996_05150 [Oscillospiraceae bacterium]|nr:hypothetical protein [Oscillospiraceae bacterium]